MTSITRFPSLINTTEGLTRDQLKQFPSLFATNAHPKMSDRYTFLSTADVIEPLLKEGYICTQATQRATRAGKRDPKFTRHMVRLRAAKVKPAVGDIFPEVIITNSHDGQCTWRMHGGATRLACLNGMTTSIAQFKGITVAHRGELESILDQIRVAIDTSAEIIPMFERMADKKMSQRSQLNFAQKAAELVWESPDFDTRVLLASRRPADEGDSVLLVYQRVQENLIRGGVAIQHTTGQARPAVTRGITHIGRGIDVNLGLWQMAHRLVA